MANRCLWLFQFSPLELGSPYNGLSVNLPNPISQQLLQYFKMCWSLNLSNTKNSQLLSFLKVKYLNLVNNLYFSLVLYNYICVLTLLISLY